MAQEQTHPLENRDRQVIDRLLQGEANNDNLADLARLLIRYENFPGAREIQQDLNLILQRWKLGKEELFQTTRYLHAQGKVYQKTSQGDAEDWS